MPSTAVPPPPPKWTFLPLPAGATAEPLARRWIAAVLGTAAASLPLQRDPRGRPMLHGRWADWDCNWSHSGDGLLVALGHRTRLGIDLEWRRPRPRALALAHRFFAESEAQWLRRLPAAEHEAAFLRLWCAKEALLKAHGHGLAFGLQRAVFVNEGGRLRLGTCDPALGAPGDWALAELAPAPGYLGALAWRAARERGRHTCAP